MSEWVLPASAFDIDMSDEVCDTAKVTVPDPDSGTELEYSFAKPGNEQLQNGR